MLPSNASADDPERGSATIEFLVAGILLLVPIVYLVIALGMVQNASLGAEATARFVARSLATGSEVPPDVIRELVASGYGLDPAALHLRAECHPATDECPAAGSTIVVTVEGAVALPLMPEIFAENLSVPVTGTATYRVERLAR
ncbi:hypothetical protein GCM10010910_02410 [Microbacterium nanhaiense]|uniref:TadE family protein n=1 Tax=Microbacterium nanhaiense TaxID=1301026 RepID=A0ABQ2MX51_9MICO|nr:TadE family protein [Microbacterium nanhaiense]GGO59441.1 hypothetical protein GCM10010910_02410 [Microbacterium nanhaiense]